MMNKTDLPSYKAPQLKAPESTPEGLKLIAHNFLGFSELFSPYSAQNLSLPRTVLFWVSLIFILILFFGIFKSISALDLLEAVFWFSCALAMFTGISWLLWMPIKKTIDAENKFHIKFDNPGELFLAHYPLKLGDSCKIRYRRPLKSGESFKENATLKARLLCSEVVTYTVGTDDKTVRQIILDQPLTHQTLSTGTQMVEFTTSIEIPKNSIPSFEAKHNRILWVIEVDLKLEELASNPKKTNLDPWESSPSLSTFAFAVDPEILS